MVIFVSQEQISETDVHALVVRKNAGNESALERVRERVFCLFVRPNVPRRVAFGVLPKCEALFSSSLRGLGK